MSFAKRRMFEEMEREASERRSERLREWVAYYNEDALFADGFDDAVIGVAQRCGQPMLVVYDIVMCIDILMKRDGMEREEAAEFFGFNVSGAFVGENTPLFMWSCREIEEDEAEA